MSEERIDVIEGTIALPYRWSTGLATARFLQGLRDRKILATRCQQCQRVLVPGRSFCPRCFVDMDDWLEVPDHGRLRTYTIVNYSFEGQPLPPPYIIGMIDLEGTDVAFSHFVGGVDLSDFNAVRSRLQRGVEMRAVWREERVGRITDIAYFEPV